MFGTKREMRQITDYLHPIYVYYSQFILLLLSLSTPFAALACICESTPVFDVLTYDNHDYVVEVEVLKKLTTPQELEADTLRPEIPGPPKPTIAPTYYEDFDIRILTRYKGETYQLSRLRTLGKGGSCYWAPKPGDRFILYADVRWIPRVYDILIVSDACQRRLMANSPLYSDEQVALEQLATARNGWLTIIDPRSSERPLARLKFKKGQPSGTWRIYDPFDAENEAPVLQIVFRAGETKRLIWTDLPLSDKTQRYVIRWKYGPSEW